MKQNSPKRIAAVIALVLIAIGIGISFVVLPPPNTVPFGSTPDSAPVEYHFINWIGQSGFLAIGYAYLLLAAIYSLKWKLTPWQCGRPIACFWFAVLVAGSLPYLWFLVVVDWYNWKTVVSMACWVMNPFVFWCIPTASFLIDMYRSEPISFEHYVAGSCVEMFVILPIWLPLAVALHLLK